MTDRLRSLRGDSEPGCKHDADEESLLNNIVIGVTIVIIIIIINIIINISSSSSSSSMASKYTSNDVSINSFKNQLDNNGTTYAFKAVFVSPF